ncbi:MAG: hypothetical protein BWY83_02566 [bacterium ADurb.Bin478]|nr:MAG: hypothetical protein BWY83_02566 [bacterium ADurb.Bin478]
MRDSSGLIAVALKHRRRLQPAVNAVEPRSQAGGKRQIGIAIRARNPAFDAQAGPVAENAKAGGAVVIAPSQPCRRPGSHLIPFIRVDGGRIKDHHLRHMADPAGKKPAKIVRALHRAQRLIAGKHIFTVLPQTDVQVAAGTGLAGVWFGHKGEADVQLLGRLLHALLVYAMPVRHGQHIAVAHVHFMLTEPPLPFRGLHRHAGLLEMSTHQTVKTLLAGALEHVIVLNVPSCGLQAAVLFLRSSAKGILIKIVLQFRPGHHGKSGLGRLFDLLQ